MEENKYVGNSGELGDTLKELLFKDQDEAIEYARENSSSYPIFNIFDADGNLIYSNDIAADEYATMDMMFSDND